MRADLRLNFLHRCISDTVVILEDDNLPYPLCPCFDILVPRTSLNGQHTTTSQCAKGEERKWLRLMADYLRASTARAFQAHGILLNLVTPLKYLGHIITSLDDDWLKLVGNLHNVRNRWVRLSIILQREGVNPRVSGMFFKSVV